MKLRLQGPENQVREIHLTGGSVSIGRGPNNDLVLRDRTISRNHCLISLSEEGEVLLEDNDSRYGTLVNGERVVGQLVVGPGDALAMGGWKGLVYDETLEGDAGDSEQTVLAIPEPRKSSSATKETRLLKKTPTRRQKRSVGYSALLIALAAAALVLLTYVILDIM